jgi:hypothetical protein
MDPFQKSRSIALLSLRLHLEVLISKGDWLIRLHVLRTFCGPPHEVPDFWCWQDSPACR